MAEIALVTGASGFVGRAVLAPLIARGFAVHAVARGAPPAEIGTAGVCWHRADLLDRRAAADLVFALRPALLVHAAWYVAHGAFWQAPENAAWKDASLALAEAFAAAGGRRFVGLGSCAEYAAAAPGDGAPWPESRTLAPGTPYGAAKVGLAEGLAALAARNAGLSVAWARLFHLFGPAESPERLVPSVIRALLAGEAARCASGTPIRDFASTGFIGRAIAAVAASPLTGAVNVASGEAIAIGDFAALVAERCGRPGLLRLGALPDRAGEVPFMAADTRRLRREFGFAEPPRTAAAIDAAIAWWQRHPNPAALIDRQ